MCWRSVCGQVELCSPHSQSWLLCSAHLHTCWQPPGSCSDRSHDTRPRCHCLRANHTARQYWYLEQPSKMKSGIDFMQGCTRYIYIYIYIYSRYSIQMSRISCIKFKTAFYLAAVKSQTLAIIFTMDQICEIFVLQKISSSQQSKYTQLCFL